MDASPPCPHSIAGSPSGNLAILRSRLHQVYKGEQQGWTGRKQGSARGKHGRAEAKNDAPVILSGTDGNQDLASTDQIGNTFCWCPISGRIPTAASLSLLFLLYTHYFRWHDTNLSESSSCALLPIKVFWLLARWQAWLGTWLAISEGFDYASSAQELTY